MSHYARVPHPPRGQRPRCRRIGGGAPRAIRALHSTPYAPWGLTPPRAKPITPQPRGRKTLTPRARALQPSHRTVISRSSGREGCRSRKTLHSSTKEAGIAGTASRASLPSSGDANERNTPFGVYYGKRTTARHAGSSAPFPFMRPDGALNSQGSYASPRPPPRSRSTYTSRSSSAYTQHC